MTEQVGQNLLKFGTGEFPAFVGRGQHLFGGFDIGHLKLPRTTTFRTGIVALTYPPA